MSILSEFAFACNSIVLKDVLSVMFESDHEIDLKLVSDMHTKLDSLGMRIRQRAELILEVERQGYSPEVFKSVKLLKDLQESDNLKARSFMKVINETELKILEKVSLIVQFYYILQKQVFVEDAHYDMPLIYNVEGRCLNFVHPEFSLITGLHFGSFRTFKSGDVKFVSRVLPHKLGLKVINLDLLGVIEDEELFGKLVDDDVIRVCLLLALEVIFMGKKLVDEIPNTLCVWLKTLRSGMTSNGEYLDELNEEFHQLLQTSFIDNRSAMVDLDFDDDIVKVEDLSRYNKATDRVHLTNAFDIFLGRLGPLRCRFSWCKDVSVDRRFWEIFVCLDPHKKGWIMDEHIELWLLLQDVIPLWYADGTSYKVAWSDVDQVFMPINEIDQHWCLAQLHIRTGVVTFYDSGITYDPE
ncbi:phospholipase-like protein [Tanacetum coccineum]